MLRFSLPTKGALVLLAGLAAPSAVADPVPSVVEVTVAAPDLLGVIIRDPEFVPGRLIAVPPSNADPESWIYHDGAWGRVVGPKRDHIRTTDTPPQTYLNRDAVDAASDYAPIGGLNVKAVYRKSMPYDSGVSRGMLGETLNGASFQHFVYLKLEGPLRPGTHRIVWPRDSLPPTAFTYSDDATRAIALRINQNGYAPADTAKVAYLALWLPGGPDEGRVDFRQYGLDRFEIRSEDGAAVFKAPIKLRRGPTDPEPGTGLPELMEIPSAAGKETKVQALHFDKTIELIAPGHGLMGKDHVWLQGFSGTLAHLNGSQPIVADTPERIRLSAQTSAVPAWSRQDIGSVLPVLKTNRAGTYVFELDFGAWTPNAEGTYHIRIPGLGVSDRFRVANDVWLTAARAAFAGLYNHRSGVALDGRFGYTRPIAFKPGRDIEIHDSKLPLVFSSNFFGGPIPFSAGAASPWLGERSSDDRLWGGYMDAGDWDRRIQHLEVSYALMDLLEHGGAKAQGARLSVPQSHEVLDEPAYREIEDASDLLHEVVWNLDFYRRLQLPDGRVRGGIESGEHPRAAEPSFLESHKVYVYAPDHVSGFRYAAAAARLAVILADLKKPSLATLYRESALKAWAAAEKGFEDPDAFYAAALEAAFAAKALDKDSWASLRDSLQRTATEYRAGAAGALFRLTGEASFAHAFETAWTAKLPFQGYFADGAWEYLHSPDGRPPIKEAIRGAFAAAASEIIAPMQAATYPSLKHPFAPAGWGQGLVPDYNVLQALLRAHALSGAPEILEALQTGSAHILGANQVGLSFTTGLGYRTIRHPLHEDHRAMGVDVPKGITIYGWAPQSIAFFDWIFSPHAWAPLPDTTTRQGGASRRVEPNRLALPYFEYLIEHPALVVQQEYTVHQSIGSTAAMWLYLHSRLPFPSVQSDSH